MTAARQSASVHPARFAVKPNGTRDTKKFDFAARHRRCGRRIFASALLAIALLNGCKGEDPRVAAQAAAAQAAAKEQAADTLGDQYAAAVAANNWQLARGYGDVLQIDHPTSAAAARVKPMLAGIKARAEADQQERRLAALWAYGDEPVKDGSQLSAAIFSQEPVDTDGGGAKPVRLIFRDHPDWGRSAYLVLEAGDFDCYSGCRLKVIADGKTHTLPGSRPKTDEAIAMFIDDHKALWKLATSSKQLAIEFPTKAVGKRSAAFEVGGLEAWKMPKWK